MGLAQHSLSLGFLAWISLVPFLLIIHKLDSISYEFVKPFGDNKYKANIVYNKIVHYFLMNKIGGNLKNHDDEFDSIYWMTLSESKKKLTYKNEIEIVEKAFSSRNKD